MTYRERGSRSAPRRPDWCDELLCDLILKGHIEISGVNPNGQLTYRTTDAGKRYMEQMGWRA